MSTFKNLVPFKRETDESTLATGRIGNLHREIDHMFDSLWKGSLFHWPSQTAALTSDLALRLDVAETPKSYLITAEMPGLGDKDVGVSLADGVLTIAGEKRDEHEVKDKTIHRIERSYGQFRRALTLPTDADENAITAKIDKGVLTVEIGKSKTAEKATRKIEVRTS